MGARPPFGLFSFGLPFGFLSGALGRFFGLLGRQFFGPALGAGRLGCLRGRGRLDRRRSGRGLRLDKGDQFDFAFFGHRLAFGQDHHGVLFLFEDGGFRHLTGLKFNLLGQKAGFQGKGGGFFLQGQPFRNYRAA